MFDDLTRDILTIIFFLITMILAIYSLDKEKVSQLKKVGIKIGLIIGVGWHFYNIIDFFFQELSHRSIFLMVISLIALSSLIILYLILRLNEVFSKHIEQTRRMEKHHSKHIDFTELNINITSEICILLEKLNQNEFNDKYKDNIDKLHTMSKV